MKKEELLTLGLTDEQAMQVVEQSKKELEGYIPKARFDEVNEAKKKAEDTIKERDAQLKEFQSLAGDNEALKTKLKEAETANKEAMEKYQADLKSARITHAIEEALIKAKAKNTTAVKALLDLASIDMDDKGKVTGLDKQVSKLVEDDSTKFLFDVQAEQAPQGKPQSPFIGGFVPHTPPSEGAGGTQSIGASFAHAYNAQFAPASSEGTNN